MSHASLDELRAELGRLAATVETLAADRDERATHRTTLGSPLTSTATNAPSLPPRRPGACVGAAVADESEEVHVGEHLFLNGPKGDPVTLTPMPSRPRGDGKSTKEPGSASPFRASRTGQLWAKAPEPAWAW